MSNGEKIPYDFGPVARIKAEERDINLNLHDEKPQDETNVAPWPRPIDRIPAWNVFQQEPNPKRNENSLSTSRYLHRRLSPSQKINNSLVEYLVRFPSAPIYRINRKPSYQVSLQGLNAHTFRFIKRVSKGEEHKRQKISRIFIMHNGLDETDNFQNYYELARELIDEDPSTACIIRPMPGHLTRFPFDPRFSESPLERYIDDPTDLFRQYLKFMVETQWLLSILVPLKDYRTAPGLTLIGEESENYQLETQQSDSTAGKGRDSAEFLAKRICHKWELLYGASVNRERLTGEPPAYPKPESPISHKVNAEFIQSSINTIRDLIDWKPCGIEYDKLDAKAAPPPLCPSLHVIGYSLGGYLAQSVFFSWPHAVSSCVTINSGGRLKDLAPSVFAHEEEWNSVMHAIRDELANAMISDRLREDDSENSGKITIAGIPKSEFLFFEKIFDEVFVQDHRSSYRSRVSEFTNRLLFVLGGDDPIVKTQSVIDASPREGINLIQIAKLSHFLHKKAAPEDWENFWRPQVCRLAVEFAKRSDLLLSRVLKKCQWQKGLTRPKFLLEGEELAKKLKGPDEGEDQHLSSKEFQIEFHKLIKIFSENGWLFSFRNTIPATLSGDNLLHKRGVEVHYEDELIRTYVSALISWQATKKCNKVRRNMTVVVPEQLEQWISDQDPENSSLWAEFHSTWTSDPNNIVLYLCNADDKSDNELDTAVRVGKSFLAHQKVVRKDKQEMINFYEQNGYDRAQTQESDEPVRLKYAYPNKKGFKISNTLADVWIAFSQKGKQELMNYVGSLQKPLSRAQFENAFKALAMKFAKNDGEAEKKLEDWLKDEHIIIIKMSSAKSNPRFRGTRIMALSKAIKEIVHCALSFYRSKPAKK